MEGNEPWYAEHFSPVLAEAGYVLRASSDPILVLKAMASAIPEINRMMHECVQDCRKQGYSWGKIGEALGISRQAAQKRFGRSYEPPHRSL